MSRLATPQDLIRHVGGSLSAPINAYYWYVFDWESVAAGGTKEASIKVDAGGDFVVDAFVGDIWMTGAGTTWIAGTPVHRASDPSPPASVGNSLPSIQHYRTEITWNDGAWGNGPIRFGNMWGTAQAPNFPMYAPIIPSAATLKIKLYNDSAQISSGQGVMIGHLVNRSK